MYSLILQIIVLKIQLRLSQRKFQDFRGTVSYFGTMKPKKLEMVVSPVGKPSEKVQSNKQKNMINM